jgi:pimeloyl-ACP methyl ester carboxylesterase
MAWASLVRTRCLLWTISLLLAAGPAAAQQQPLEFHLTFDRTVSPGPFSGRVYVLFSKAEIKQLHKGFDWFHPEPILARDVKDWQPGQSLVVGADALGYPYSLAKLPRGEWSVQAVMDFDRGARQCTTAPGNAYSKARRLTLDPAATGPVALHLDQVYQDRAFTETPRIKLVEVESKLLTAFHGRPTRLRAGVILPESFAARPQQRYPVVYEIPGFSGDHHMAHEIAGRNLTNLAGVEVIHVMLDPDCRTGHHVFADSENNGPCGRALIEELIPAVESRFRGIGNGRGRLVTGHSSGGWSSLWLQITYPDEFAGVWSTSPDPVDFRDFQKINLTQTGVNMFIDDKGNRRPLARQDARPLLWYKTFSDMEEVMGHGGQLCSFEAVFSPRGLDGQPRRLWNRSTGAVDAEVARAWQRYDIRRVLEENWPALGPKLAGKLHVYCGGADTFFLDGAVMLLRQSLHKLGSDAVVEIFPGKDHNLFDAALRQRINAEMAERLRQSLRPTP